jgi:serine/threonine protein kinase
MLPFVFFFVAAGRTTLQSITKSFLHVKYSNKLHTGMSEYDLFINEGMSLTLIESNKHKCNVNCTYTVPRLLNINFVNYEITTLWNGVGILTLEGKQFMKNLNQNAILSQFNCISSLLECVHVQHCDIQPKNFVIHKSNIYLIDFDMSTNKYSIPSMLYKDDCHFNITKQLFQGKYKKLWMNYFEDLGHQSIVNLTRDQSGYLK